MKKSILLLLIPLILFVAYITKPSDKTCIIEAVKFVWGQSMPTPERPIYYEQFMDLTSKSVVINDRIFLKQIKYKFVKETKTVGYGAFAKVIRVGF